MLTPHFPHLLAHTHLPTSELSAITAQSCGISLLRPAVCCGACSPLEQLCTRHSCQRASSRIQRLLSRRRHVRVRRIYVFFVVFLASSSSFFHYFRKDEYKMNKVGTQAGNKLFVRTRIKRQTQPLKILFSIFSIAFTILF